MVVFFFRIGSVTRYAWIHCRVGYHSSFGRPDSLTWPDKIPNNQSNQPTGLERAGPLAKDIEWFAQTYSDVTVPEVGPYGKAYAAFLKVKMSIK